MVPISRRTPGLLLRGRVWHIDKVIYGKRICESSGTKELAEAEALLARRVTQARQVHLFGEQLEHTFREAAAKFLAENRHKRSRERDVRARLDKGRSPGTINRDLAVVRRILKLASRLWRDDTDRPWLPVAPLIQMQRHLHAREPYLLSVAEQRLLFSELEEHGLDGPL